MNVYHMSKKMLFNVGVAHAELFLEENKIEMPDEIVDRVIPTVRPPSGTYGCGVYLPRQRKIMVNSDACAAPARGTPRQYSFPMYSVDRTPVGVVAHEVGHYVDHVWSYASNNLDWCDAVRGSKVSSYEPNMSEAFAESMRLYILNPELLRAIAPRRHDFFRHKMGLNTVGHEDPLKKLSDNGAAEGILVACENKLAKARYVFKRTPT